MLNVSTVGVTRRRGRPKQSGMAEIHATMTRLYAAFAEVVRAGNPRAKIGQSALARKLHTSPQAVKNWETRGISQRGAQDAQRILGVNATWILNGTGPMFAGGSKVSMLSQPATLDPDILHEALTLLEWDEREAGTYPPRAQARRLAALYSRIVVSGGTQLSSEQNAEFLREVEARKGEQHARVEGQGARKAGRR